MYDQSYEDYMKNVLGYPTCNCNSDRNSTYMNQSSYYPQMENWGQPPMPYMPGNPMPVPAPYITENPAPTPFLYETENMDSMNDINAAELEGMYPERYKIIYPMVCKVCNENSDKAITEELLSKMAEEIYFSVETDEEPAVVKMNVRTAPLKNGDVPNPRVKVEDTRSEDRIRRPKNLVLNDFIRVLILRELLGRPRPIRSPFPPRPPFKPGFPGHRDIGEGYNIPPIY